jgi:hypothetical protein
VSGALRRFSRRDLLGGALAASALVVLGSAPVRLAKASPVRGDVRVSRDGYAGHAEPCLAVNPADPGNLLAACALNSPPTVATYLSFDQGSTWRRGGALGIPAGIEGSGNLSAAFDGVGNGFICGLLVATDGSKGAERGVAVWRTTDGGRSFDAPVAVTGMGSADRPWVAVEPRRPWTVHVAWAEGDESSLGTTDLRYASSTDGGRTFEAPRALAVDREGLGNPIVACGPAGGVCINYSRGSGAQEHEPDAPVRVCVISSRDGGRIFSSPTTLGSGVNLIGFTNGIAGSSSLPALAADPRSGLICSAFSTHRAGADRAGILLSVSRDGGRSWSRAGLVTPADRAIYFEPELAIDSAGRIGLMAYSMERDLVSVVLMVSDPGSSRFGPPITISGRPFAPNVVADSRGRWWLGDYQALAAASDGFHALWSDTRTGRLELFTAVSR